MKFKKNFGILLIVVLCLLTISVWLVERKGTATFEDYDTATHSLGQLTGLVGMTLFALTFVLSTRLKIIEDWFGGLDKVYKAHHLIGAVAFILLLFHPLLLVVKFIPRDIRQAALYLLPSGSWGVNFGIIALGLMTLLIILTLYISLKYQNWKLSHKFMGLVYLFALLHIFIVDTDITYYPLLRNYMIFISILGGGSFIYGSLLYGKVRKKYAYLVDSVERRGPNVIISLKAKHQKMEYQAGQFAFIRFPEVEDGKEQHPFTIASSPHNESLVFAIKSLGDFTSWIQGVREGMHVELEGPYGENYSEVGEKNQLWIAGGIGITPFLGLAEEMMYLPLTPIKTTLYYCVRNREEAVFLEELERVHKKNKNFVCIPWYSDSMGPISIKEIQKRNDIKNSEIYLCGPPRMMDSLCIQLKKEGVAKKSIHMEEFNLK